MTTTQITERKNLYRMIRTLSDEDIEKVVSYTAYLRYVEGQEDAEDIAAWETRKDEPVFSLSEVKESLGIK